MFLRMLSLKFYSRDVIERADSTGGGIVQANRNG